MAARFEIYRTQDGGVEQLRLRPGENRVRVLPGRQFRLQDSNLDAEQLRVLQVDSDLVIENVPLDGDAGTASVILEGYYRICSASDQCAVTAGGDETVSIPEAAEGAGGAVLLADVNTKPLGALNDGTFVLYDPKFEAPILPVLGDVPTKPLLYGLGGAAVLGLAAAGGGGGGGGDGQAPQGNISLTLKSATYFNTRFPVLNGTAEPGSEVQVRIDTDGDQHANVTYTTTADANGNWAVDLKTATPSSGALPAAGLSDTNSLEVVGSNKGVQSTLPLTTLHFDDTPPASAEVASVAGDNIITAPERAAGVAISGTAEANGSVELKLGTLTRLVAVDANGNWSTTLQADDLPTADGSYTLSATAIDAAGNRAPEVTSKVIMNTTGTAAIIGTISEDGYVNAKEAAAPVKVMGTAAPNSKVALWLTDEKNPLAEVQADANGKWEAGVPLPAGLADGKHALSVTTTNAQGNTATSKAEFTLDKTPPKAATDLELGGKDTIITSTEAKNGVSLSGTGEAGAKVTVSIAGGKTQTATVGANGGWKVEFKEGDLPMPGQGNSTNTAFNVVLQDKAGNDSAVATQNVTLQGPLLPLGKPIISTIAGDDIINAAEAQGAVSVSGIADAGSIVRVKLGTLETTAQAGGDGRWTAQLTNLARVPDGSYDVTAVATQPGRADSVAGVHKITLDKTAPGQPTNIKTNGGDTTISADEAKTGKITFTGDTPTGAQNADTVTVTWNGVSKPGTVTNGKWSVDFDSVPPVPAGQASVPATVTVQAHDKAGNNSTTATQAITVQNSALPSSAPTIDPVTADNVVNKAESGAVTITGTAAPGASMLVKVDTWTAPPGIVADAQGKWSVQNVDMGGLTDNKTHTVTAVATAPGGTPSSPETHQFEMDRTPPGLTITGRQNAETITPEEAKQGVTFSGTTEAGSTLKATWNGKPIDISNVRGLGLWTVKVPATEIPPAPANGTAKTALVVTSTDKAGNTAETTLNVTIQGAPAVTRQTTVNGKVANDDVINAVEANGVEVSGTAEPNSNIRVLVPGTKVATSVRSGADGIWKASLDFTGLQDGQHTIEATASQPGSTSTSVGTHTVTLAQKLPDKPTNLQFDGHASKVITAAEAADGVTVTGDAAPGSTVQVKLGDTTLPAKVDAAGHFSATLPAPTVTPGGKQPYSVTVTVADAAGNTPQSWAEQIEVQGSALKPATPVPAAVTTAAVTPATPDAEADAAGGAAAQPATPTAPAAAPAPDAAAQPAAPAAQPSALGVAAGDTLGKSLATAKALPGHQGSRLSLNELLDQGETLSLPGEASSAGSNAATSAAGSAAGTGTAPAAPAGADVATAVDSGASALSSTATVNTLLGTQQPWETAHPAL
ncbi:Ig-like domain-containing protein [Lautropia mirabilis]|uniref:Ig-like domain-containing protein n=1 Tax=Lautropia mirabilis TaxID=47671 RepID=UPI0028EDB53A|nr:Ig-like domain-containing protein [Lautropia mirabilis]